MEFYQYKPLDFLFRKFLPEMSANTLKGACSRWQSKVVIFLLRGRLVEISLVHVELELTSIPIHSEHLIKIGFAYPILTKTMYGRLSLLLSSFYQSSHLGTRPFSYVNESSLCSQPAPFPPRKNWGKSNTSEKKLIIMNWRSTKWLIQTNYQTVELERKTDDLAYVQLETLVVSQRLWTRCSGQRSVIVPHIIFSRKWTSLVEFVGIPKAAPTPVISTSNIGSQFSRSPLSVLNLMEYWQ